MGPLLGIRVIEFEAPGPVAWAGMMLSDLGADVTRVVRPAQADTRDERFEFLLRGRKPLRLDLKNATERDRALEATWASDVLLEGMRPGVMERLGLGPETCLARNPALVYGRMTGWGQTGPRAQSVGHDINFLAITGALHAIGPRESPAVPLNLVGDFGGGAMLLVAGVLGALLHARTRGEGQVVDAAMVDGALALMASTLGRFQANQWKDERESNLVDGGAPFYRTYRTADGKFMAVGAIEPRFYQALLHGLGLSGQELPPQGDRARWPDLRDRFAMEFARHSRAHWVNVFDGTAACVTPVLSLKEVTSDPHLVARRNFLRIAGTFQPAPAPRFSGIASRPTAPGMNGLKGPAPDRRLDPKRMRELETENAKLKKLLAEAQSRR